MKRLEDYVRQQAAPRQLQEELVRRLEDLCPMLEAIVDRAAAHLPSQAETKPPGSALPVEEPCDLDGEANSTDEYHGSDKDDGLEEDDGLGEDDEFGLARFVRAQDNNDTFKDALAELRKGRKKGFWMWCVFPQLLIGSNSRFSGYAISGCDEASAYLAHPVLGPRLDETALAVAGSPAPRLEKLMGTDEGLQLRSCMTLFAALTLKRGERARADAFMAVLYRYFGGSHDEETLDFVKANKKGKKEKKVRCSSSA